MTLPDDAASNETDPPSIRFDLFSLFPEMFAGPLASSILGRAIERGIVAVALHDPRQWATDRHRTVDDTPYGGGPGMVMKAPPLVAAVESALGEDLTATRLLMLSAGGVSFTQALARDLAGARRVALICGHYEGIDERVRESLGCTEVSVGDYVLTGGELAALVIVDAVSRLVPGVIDDASLADESHAAGLLEYPHYTRPVEFRGLAVPEILLSGHHARIAAWRRRQAILKTARLRPDLLANAELTEEERSVAASAREPFPATD